VPGCRGPGGPAHPRAARTAAAAAAARPSAPPASSTGVPGGVVVVDLGCTAARSSGGELVWLVWEDDEVLGVYVDPDTAAADCAALRRHAQRERLVVRYDWMAVPVFTGRRHQTPTAGASHGAIGRCRW